MVEMLIKYVSVAVMDQDGILYSDEDEHVSLIANELLIKYQNVVVKLKKLEKMDSCYTHDHVMYEKYWNESEHI